MVRAVLKFSAHVFQRPGEVRQAEWVELDLENALWRISAERMKLRREHLVPLSRQVVEVLRRILIMNRFFDHARQNAVGRGSEPKRSASNWCSIRTRFITLAVPANDQRWRSFRDVARARTSSWA